VIAEAIAFSTSSSLYNHFNETMKNLALTCFARFERFPSIDNERNSGAFECWLTTASTA
jgi:hypothetical protein